MIHYHIRNLMNVEKDFCSLIYKDNKAKIIREHKA